MHQDGRRTLAGAGRAVAGWGAAGLLLWGTVSFAMGREDSSLRRLYAQARRRTAERRSMTGDGIDGAARDALRRMDAAHRALRSYSAEVVMTVEGSGESGGAPWREQRRGQIAFRRPGSAAVTFATTDRNGHRRKYRTLADGAGVVLFPDPERDPLGVAHVPGGVGWSSALTSALRLAGADVYLFDGAPLLGDGAAAGSRGQALVSLTLGEPAVRDGVACVTVVGVKEFWADGEARGTRETHVWRIGRDDGLLREHSVDAVSDPRGATARTAESFTAVRADPDLPASLFALPVGTHPFDDDAKPVNRYPMLVEYVPSGDRKQKAKRAAHVLAAALAGYLWDHDMTLPAGADWEEKLAPYVPTGRSWALPKGQDGRPHRWVLNAAVAGRRVGMNGTLRERFGGPALSEPDARSHVQLNDMPTAFFEAPGTASAVMKAPAWSRTNLPESRATVTTLALACLREPPLPSAPPGSGPPPGFEGGPP